MRALSLIGIVACAVASPARGPVGAIYFGDWHPDTNMEAAHGKGWTEFDLVTTATPRYPGHVQPNVPLWPVNASTREDTVPGMELRLEAASAAGIDFFLFDWYWYQELGPTGKGGPFLDGALDAGYLPVQAAGRGHNVSFALMWANQDWVDIHPAKAGYHSTFRSSNASVPKDMLLVFDGYMPPSVYEAAFETIVGKYMALPQYLRVATPREGGKACPYFALYQVPYLIQAAGGIPQAAQVLRAFRAEAAAHPSVGCVHIAGMDLGPMTPQDVAALGLDSATNYGWMKLVSGTFPQTPYQTVAKEAFAQLPKLETRWGVPYVPAVSVAWDPAPRCAVSDTFEDRGYPWTAAWRSTPAEWQAALTQARSYVEGRCSDASGFCPPLLLNAWNEWSEGAYLEPDQREGSARLDAVRAVFGNPEA